MTTNIESRFAFSAKVPKTTILESANKKFSAWVSVGGRRSPLHSIRKEGDKKMIAYVESIEAAFHVGFQNNLLKSEVTEGVNCILRLDGSLAENSLTFPDSINYHFKVEDRARTTFFTGGLTHPQTRYHFLPANVQLPPKPTAAPECKGEQCEKAHQTIVLNFYYFRQNVGIRPNREAPQGAFKISDHRFEKGHRIGWETISPSQQKGEESQMLLMDSDPFLTFEFRYRPKEMMNVGSQIQGLFGTVVTSKNMSSSGSESDDWEQEMEELTKKTDLLLGRTEKLEKQGAGLEERLMAKMEERISQLEHRVRKLESRTRR